MLEIITIFSPLFGFILSIFNINYKNYKFSQYSTSGLLILSSILSWFVFFKIFNSGLQHKILLFDWIKSGDLNIQWNITIDTLASIMLIVVTNVSASIHIYSIGYMKGDNSIPRFMGYLSLFTFFMLILVTSDNLLQMFFGWEGVGLASYLLIGFWYKKESANKAAIKAFIVNRIGDFGFLLGIGVIYLIFNTIYFEEIFSQIYLFENHKINFLSLNISTLNTICILLFIGAMGKSAQIGLHTWLPDAMEGPTPVSALIHAATMVTAGVFMIARMSPIFSSAEFASNIIIFVGALTAIFAASVAITQNDIKKIIAYSTCSQLGYMFFAAGLGAYNASIFHLMTHGFFKALLFLCAGSVIHAMNEEQNIKNMGGLSKKLPLTTILMWIGSLAIIGFPYFSGYYSKESILEAAYYGTNNLAYFSYYIGIITAFLTAIYSWRLLFLTFHVPNNSSKEIYENAHESPMIMILPKIFLAIGSIFIGFISYDLFIGKLSGIFWSNSIILIHSNIQHMPLIQSLIIKISVAIGIILSTFFCYYNKNITNKIINKKNRIYLFLLNKWYFDELYNWLFVKPSFRLASLFWIRGDEKIIDAYGPIGISKIVKFFAKNSSKFQTGYLYHYAFTMLLGLVILLTWYLYFRS